MPEIKDLSATDASRGFKDMLDLVDQGTLVRITRGKKKRYMLTTAPEATGADINALVDRWHHESTGSMMAP